MSTSLEAVAVACAVCGGEPEPVVELPSLPLTALFTPQPPTVAPPAHDQALLYCPTCGHGQLARRLPAASLYDATYSFRTSASGTARRGTDWFVSVVDELAPGRRFHCAVDVGCNDFYLLRQLAGRAARRVGVDPLWAVETPAPGDPGIEVIGGTVESTDFDALGEAPDLIVCRHTLEHVAEPLAALEKLLSVAATDALLVFEVPGFDALVARLRFDQVFHQHYHYYSLASFTRLLAAAGGRYLAHRANYHDWGAMLVAFTKGAESRPPADPPGDLTELRQRYELFRRHLTVAAEALERLPAPRYGYGAAQMLPVIAWHLGTDLSCLTAVLDDDPAKDGWWYANLPLQIRRPPVDDWSAASVLVTAVDNAAPILTRLMAERPRHVLFPLPVI